MNLQNIPIEIQKLPQWVCTRSDNKIPMMSTSYTTASSVDPATWSSFDTAKESVVNGNYDYVGFVFNDNGIVGVDIDDAYDEYGILTPLAAGIIGRCGSYTERSKSGSGIHILLKGELPFKGKNNLKGVEIYKASRFFIITGDIVLYTDMIENQEAIDYIVETHFPETRECESSKLFTGRIYHPVWEKPHEKIKLRPVYPRIHKGSRNICLTSLAGMLHTLGYSPKQIYEEISYCNTVACEPTLHSRELETIVRSVTRYKR